MICSRLSVSYTHLDVYKRQDVRIAIIAVPAAYAQDVADAMVDTKIQGILNFAPVVLTVPEEIETRNVDLAVNLEVLSFNIESSLRATN